MDKAKALQRLLDGKASHEDIEMLKQSLAIGEISIQGDVNHSFVLIGNGNNIVLNEKALSVLKPKGSMEEASFIEITPIPRESDNYVSLRIESKVQDKPVFCKAIIRKMERYILDENNDVKETVFINTDEDGPLSWHYGGTDNDGFKKIVLNPEFINVARFPKDMDSLIRQNIIFTHLVDKPRKEGKYKIWVEILCLMGEISITESWLGCISLFSGVGSRSRELAIYQCD